MVKSDQIREREAGLGTGSVGRRVVGGGGGKRVQGAEEEELARGEGLARNIVY